MHPLLREFGDAHRAREAAAGVLSFVGAVAVVAEFGNRPSLLTGLLPYVGAVALAVFVGTVGGSVVRELSWSDDTGSGPDTADHLELYQAEGCPHCAKVRRFCTEAGISLALHNPRTEGTPLTDGTVTDRDRYEELTGYGQDQIPLLVDTDRGESVYESDEIVAYLAEHYA